MQLKTKIPDTAKYRNHQSEAITANAKKAYDATLRLSVSGFTVLNVRINDNQRPVIEVAHTRLCDRLKGAAKIRRNNGQGIERVMAAIYEDCQVQWIE